MKVFLSWSGIRSRAVALTLREWLPVILQSVEPWMSDTDIRAGSRWSTEVGRQLQHAGFGIICLTQDNAAAPWILFEAGALAQSFEEGAVCPYLLDLPYKDLSGPLAQFQGKKADEQGTYEVIAAINERADVRLAPDRLDKIFGKVWPEIERALSGIPPSIEITKPSRPDPDVLEELVTIVRRMERRLDGPVETQQTGATTSPDLNQLFQAATQIDISVLRKHVEAAAAKLPAAGLADQIGISERALNAFLRNERPRRPSDELQVRRWFANEVIEGRLLDWYVWPPEPEV